MEKAISLNITRSSNIVPQNLLRLAVSPVTGVKRMDKAVWTYFYHRWLLPSKFSTKGYNREIKQRRVRFWYCKNDLCLYTLINSSKISLLDDFFHRKRRWKRLQAFRSISRYSTLQFLDFWRENKRKREFLMYWSRLKYSRLLFFSLMLASNFELTNRQFLANRHVVLFFIEFRSVVIDIFHRHKDRNIQLKSRIILFWSKNPFPSLPLSPVKVA